MGHTADDAESVGTFSLSSLPLLLRSQYSLLSYNIK